MTTHRAAPVHAPTTRTLAVLGAGVRRALSLLPSAVIEASLLARADRDGARRQGGGATGPVDRAPSVGAVLAHAGLTAALGGAVWFLTALALLGAARGPFYGFVDPGPYDHSWGGPTLAGAWAVHALVWLAVLPAWGLLTWVLVGLHRCVTARLLDGTGPWWAVPVAVVVVLGFLLFLRAWVHQL